MNPEQQYPSLHLLLTNLVSEQKVPLSDIGEHYLSHVAALTRKISISKMNGARFLDLARAKIKFQDATRKYFHHLDKDYFSLSAEPNADILSKFRTSHNSIEGQLDRIIVEVGDSRVPNVSSLIGEAVLEGAQRYHKYEGLPNPLLGYNIRRDLEYKEIFEALKRR